MILAKKKLTISIRFLVDYISSQIKRKSGLSAF